MAQRANLLLVAATSASGGIEADAQYLVQTTPLPAQVMTISFGACESAGGSAGVTFWDTLFQQAAAEGISSFVSSGDSGASGCDAAFAAPPASPKANSPNYICSSSYATCVGGTEFNDLGNPNLYWSPTNNSGELESAFGYIPEGAWNEPLDSSLLPMVASSGGGVSSVISTPAWQTGVGVPAARTGRYTPDVSFSASCHDGYFACFAAAGDGTANCVANASGYFYFVSFCGTSASAPSMAGVAALLDQQIGGPQGNLNPQLYQLAAGVPAVFNDASPATSGVAACDLNTPSMCNNSIPGTAGLAGGQPGFPLTVGYDEVTGLGSLNIATFLNSWNAPPTIKSLGTPPGSMSFPSEIVGYSESGQLGIQNGGSSDLNPMTISIIGPNASDFTQTNNCQYVLSSHFSCQGTVTFTPTAAGTRTATLSVTSSNAANSPFAITLNGIGSTTPFVPNVTVNASPSQLTTIMTATMNIFVDPQTGYPNPTGSVILTVGGYTSAPASLNNTEAIITFPPGTLAIGSYTATAVYTPDTASSKLYSSATGTAGITVSTPVKTTPMMQIWPYSISTPPYLAPSATVTITGIQGNPTPTGSITLSSPVYTSAPVVITGGGATITIPAETLPVGNTLVTATYTPIPASSSISPSTTGTVTMGVQKINSNTHPLSIRPDHHGGTAIDSLGRA